MQTPSLATSTGSAAAGACDPATIARLKRYGDHAKAAYVLYGHFGDSGLQPAEMQSNGLRALTERDSQGNGHKNLGNLQGLEGYTIVAKLMAYPGRAGVFSVPTPITDEGLVGLAAVEKPSLIGYIAEGTGLDDMPELVIAFRGTSCRADWETNLLGAVATEGLFGNSNCGLVHRGFFNLINGTPDDAEQDTNPLKTIKAVLAHYKATHEDEQPRIITTGHSLGGALAIVAAVCIAHCTPGYCQESPDYTARKLQTYTFAAPRIGDRTLAEYLSSRLKYTAVQLKNKPDVVPYTPPAGLRATLSALNKLIGMRPRRECAAGEVSIAAADGADNQEDMSTDMERWETYQGLLEGLDSTATDEQQLKELEQYIAEAEKQYDAADGDFITAASESVYQKIWYGGQLLTTVATKWWDNPAPRNGLYILDVHKSGRWGGQNHSLEVYLDHLDAGAWNNE